MAATESIIEEHIEANVAEFDRNHLLTITFPPKVKSMTQKAKADESIILPTTLLVNIK